MCQICQRLREPRISQPARPTAPDPELISTRCGQSTGVPESENPRIVASVAPRERGCFSGPSFCPSSRSFLARTAYTNSCMAGELRRQPNCAVKKFRERWTPELQNERLQLANKAAELKTCSKPIHAFPEIPRFFALLRPSGAKAGTTAGRRRKLRESFPPNPRLLRCGGSAVARYPCGISLRRDSENLCPFADRDAGQFATPVWSRPSDIRDSVSNISAGRYERDVTMLARWAFRWGVRGRQ